MNGGTWVCIGFCWYELVYIWWSGLVNLCRYGVSRWGNEVRIRVLIVALHSEVICKN